MPLFRRGAREREALRRAWGAEVSRPRAFPVYREWLSATETPAGSYVVDDQTWLDLDVDRLYSRADRTLSGPGRFALYRWLRTPTSSLEVLQARDRAIDLFTSTPAVRDTVREELERAGRLCRSDADLADLLWGEPTDPGGSGVTLGALGLLGALSVGAALVYGGAAIPIAVLVFAANGYVHQRVRLRHQPALSALVELGALLRSARALTRLEGSALDAWRQRLADGLSSTRALLRPLSLISAGRAVDLLYEYVSVLLLLEARALGSALREVAAHRAALREVFLALGELDALQSTASLRQGLPLWSKPEISDPAGSLVVEDAVHPLLESPTPNSVSLDRRGCLVTGANMAGKSTFLRVLGVNAILAQTLYTCSCRRYAASRLQVLSSMEVTDSLAEGKSLFLAEAQRILEIVRASDGAHATLCLIDEMLAGTNAADRSAASRAVLAYLAGRSAIVVAATHDVELAEGLAGVLDGYHFDDAPGEAEEARHRLRSGTTAARNAIRLLEELGYPAEVMAAMKASATRSS